MAPEWAWAGAGTAAYWAAAARGVQLGARGVGADRWVPLGLLAGVAFLAVGIALRWARLHYGPFLTLFEVLLSNAFSLGLVYLAVYWRVPAARAGAVVVLPVLALLGLWALFAPTEAGRLPATYRTAWLWVHVGVGKLFLGLCLSALGLAGVLLARYRSTHPGSEVGRIDKALLDRTLWRLMAVALVFHTLMLIAGAVWAQDAWGRYWTWDPLETSAFLTWLALALTLHARLTLRVADWIGWVAVAGIFVLAFVTFFGVPFTSVAPHKGIL